VAIYLDSNGDNTTGASWATAYTSWGSLISGHGALASGDIVWINTGASPHAETGMASTTFTGPSSGLPAYIIGVDKADDSYNAASAAVFSTSDPNDFVIDGSICIFGIHFVTGDRFTMQAGDTNEMAYFQDCVFDCQTDNFTFTTGRANFKNCTFTLGTAGSITTPSGTWDFFDGAVTGSAASAIYGNAGNFRFYGTDLTGVSHSTTPFQASNAGIVQFYGCLLPSTSWALSTSITSRLEIYESDTATGDSPWRNEWHGGYLGKCVMSTTVYRDGGGTYDGTNGYCYALTTAGLNTPWSGVCTPWVTGYLPADSGTQTTWTVYFANTTGATNNDDVWLEVEYFGTASSTQKSFLTTGLSDARASNSPNTSDSSTWTGIISETAERKATTAVTVQVAGMYRWRVCSAATPVIYVDPVISVVQE